MKCFYNNPSNEATVKRIKVLYQNNPHGVGLVKSKNKELESLVRIQTPTDKFIGTTSSVLVYCLIRDQKYATASYSTNKV